MTIKAIETRYKGYRFRSRLEARWAVFFDHLGIEYQYEPQGFEKDGVRYLPDFLLTKSETWVEVKGSDAALKEDAESKLEPFLDYGSPLPGFDNSDTRNEYYQSRGLLILGDIPDPNQTGIYYHTMVRHHKGLYRRLAYFFPKCFGTQVRVIGDEAALVVSLVVGYLHDELPLWSTKPIFMPTQGVWADVLEAYRAARSARFEHGENGDSPL